MSTEHDGGPAFPVPSVGTGDPRDGMTRGSDGMTLRDYFAGQETLAEWDNPGADPSFSMCEALAGQPRPSHGWVCKSGVEWLAMFRWDAKWRAALKYIRADEMIAARQKGGAK